MKMPEEEKKLHIEAFDEAIHNLEVLKGMFAQEEIKKLDAIRWVMLAKKNFEGIGNLLEISAQNLAGLILRQKADGIKKEKSDASKPQTGI